MLQKQKAYIFIDCEKSKSIKSYVLSSKKVLITLIPLIFAHLVCAKIKGVQKGLFSRTLMRKN